RIAIVVARFNAFVTDRLRDGAVAALREAGAAESAIHIFPVPGAFEIPQAARAAAETGRFDAIVCLGCLIRGETPHFDYIASAAPVPEETRAFAIALMRGTIDRVKEADELIAAHARNWRVERMAVIDRLVLRLAIYELLTEPDTPAKVIINEALELARTFSG